MSSSGGGKRVLTFVTGNKKKLEEVVSIISTLSNASFPYELRSMKIDLPELQGEPEDIAKAKCRRAALEIDGAVLVEDTSLHFKSLKGLPGPYIKWFLEKLGHDGLNKMLSAYDDKGAYAQCTFGFLASPKDEAVRTFVGKTHGKIVPARGPKNFGWDPIFEPLEGTSLGKTYAEMSKDSKNAISHRYRALKALCEFFEKGGEDARAHYRRRRRYSGWVARDARGARGSFINTTRMPRLLRKMGSRSILLSLLKSPNDEHHSDPASSRT